MNLIPFQIQATSNPNLPKPINSIRPISLLIASTSQDKRSPNCLYTTRKTIFREYIGNDKEFLIVSLQDVEILLEDNKAEMVIERRLIANRKRLTDWVIYDEDVTREWEP